MMDWLTRKNVAKMVGRDDCPAALAGIYNRWETCYRASGGRTFEPTQEALTLLAALYLSLEDQLGPKSNAFWQFVPIDTLVVVQFRKRTCDGAFKGINEDKPSMLKIDVQFIGHRREQFVRAHRVSVKEAICA